MTESDVEAASEVEGARAGRCAIVGRPNVGKSTLLNAILGQKLAIATSKPQTTRHRILGVYTAQGPQTQIAFVDTPGLHRPKNALGRALVEEAQGAIDGSDVVLWLIESPSDKTSVGPSLSTADKEVRDFLRTGTKGPKLVIGLNKVDRLKDKTKLMPWLEFYHRELAPEAVVPIAALKDRGLTQLVGELRKHMPLGMLLYDDPDFVTDRPERFFVAELVREAAIRNTHEEVPYAVAVLIESFEEGSTLTRIQASIIVEKNNHKKIVVGAGGSMLKKIGSEARAEIEKLLDRKVFLGLFVKVIEGWTEDPQRVRELAMETSS
ncbi:MAG: GTP-binding protein Era [Myxococcaceae bacterium]|nr:GTP-binding protein Era [Myxococcaceae bacterium]